MAKIKILSDSTSDLTNELIEKYDIGIVPLYVNFKDTVCKDYSKDVSPQIIYDYVARTGLLPGTIGVSVDDFKVEFSKWRNLGYEIICHTISNDISCTYQNAIIAAKEVGGVWVVDTRSLSSGEGHLVLNSAELARRGMDSQNIFNNSKELSEKVSTSFIIDTLEYLKKGGRCSMISALGANLLKIKPMIAMDDGKLELAQKFRGSFKKVLEDYVDFHLEGHNDIRTERIFITHTLCDPGILDAVTDRVKKHIKFKEIIESTAGSTITCHCGPNTLGIIYLKK